MEVSMPKLRKLISVLLLVCMLALFAPATFAGDMLTPGFTGDVQTPGITGEIQGAGRLILMVLFKVP
jgi:hypothetical protein